MISVKKPPERAKSDYRQTRKANAPYLWRHIANINVLIKSYMPVYEAQHSNPHSPSARHGCAPHLPRFPSLEVFGRRPSLGRRAPPLVATGPASQNPIREVA
jgi:hypothetical protein